MGDARRLAIEANASLVLNQPQHYHVSASVYDHEKDGQFVYATAVELVGNDLRLIKSRALALAEPRQTQLFVRSIKQCGDATH